MNTAMSLSKIFSILRLVRSLFCHYSSGDKEMKVKLYRYADVMGTTMGRLKVGDKWFHTVEDSWKDNNKQISCIPLGKYRVVGHNWDDNQQFKYSRVWRLLDVKNRTGILMHQGNTHEDTMGCIIIGKEQGELYGKPAVLSSRLAIDELRDILGQRPFEIEITNIWSEK